ncbi:PilT/PilU family type 4a pilus ATPase [Cobetia amphilecti]|jgi:twitching motility protein PilU|uniref:PilT/PilU family type 4a pilus ATPase n=1 Tax=Cobetia amphilecti TaxID=1055104 RepID=A0AAP4TZ60_9GAMM|nr:MULTISPECIES: PilT/PilU family type 4a pilus ATPase [Cobetia]AVV33974.1 type IV pili twitching motility protein PilT [Halomonas sp. SF2003]MBR9754931.1 PilT/PilU family type 4a pilus ATPase [Gammaproteobacteria bacterium]TCJ24672.1 PilT/PilU family type 4a pilus ATPase [Halomonas sp. GDM18]KGA02442.1 twitching motility protein PilT [Cobetia amphilecti]KPM78418.1 twitching motility protein PilT [Cobetia sp. UCD-24C]|tara:strand:- start:370 stop:1524 length:1155 start_codon:yes stop_codon:yes gene_type:complete
MTPHEWLHELLQLMVSKGSSDLFISTGTPPQMKVNGRMVALGDKKLSVDQVRELVLAPMSDMQRERFEEEREANFAHSLPGVGRFRISAFYQRSQMGMVIRRIQLSIPSLEELRLPEIIKGLSETKRGLVIFVGGTGAGKSTSLAAMIQHRNQTSSGHIICIEDPIEYIHPHQRSIVTQREVGIDTESFEVALRNTLRQAPDVIMIGEIRSRETMEHALTFAETGHLCLATLHANNANQALDRIIHFFPEERHEQVWMDLSLNLKGIVAQQLLPHKSGNTTQRVPAIEVMLRSPLIVDLIRKGAVVEIKDVMKRSQQQGMMTFDQSLYALHQQGLITEEVALAHADSANDLRLMIKFGDSDSAQEAQLDVLNAASRFSLQGDDD